MSLLEFKIHNIVRTEIEYVHYNDESELASFLGGWLPHVKHLPIQAQNEFLLDFTDLYIEKIHQSVGQYDEIVVPFSRIEIEIGKA